MLWYPLGLRESCRVFFNAAHRGSTMLLTVNVRRLATLDVTSTIISGENSSGIGRAIVLTLTLTVHITMHTLACIIPLGPHTSKIEFLLFLPVHTQRPEREALTQGGGMWVEASKSDAARRPDAQALGAHHDEIVRPRLPLR